MLDTPATIAAARRVIGATPDELAELLDVHPRTIRAMESGKFTASPGLLADYAALLDEHRQLAEALQCDAEAGHTVTLRRDGDRPRGWHLAAAARVLSRHPDARFDWAD